MPVKVKVFKNQIKFERFSAKRTQLGLFTLSDLLLFDKVVW